MKYMIGAEELKTKLSKKAQKVLTDSKLAVTVGYTAPYAVYVHEDLSARHTTGQAKFLEQPARKLARWMHLELLKLMKGGRMDLPKALFTVGLKLQMDSQELVPIDTGKLHGSAFTKLERY